MIYNYLTYSQGVRNMEVKFRLNTYLVIINELARYGGKMYLRRNLLYGKIS